ncbi:hypothetical protein EKO04_009523 [Ascochyta lentis]|uniref:AB hydrolase-1 domain-containing protein n=1 Tax=Ascochyta lentis TaxID=205686 RepID=A0A8H7IW78_9PLEO|nr:hypothetical protein EKO04_009523 [Ascochyta lentis]
MEKDLPTVVIVPGFWESATGVFDETVAKLQEQGLEVVVAELRSTGHGSSEGITLDDDIIAVRGYIDPLVSEGREVVIAGHSAGGFIGSSAVEALTRKSRIEAGKPGGVVAFAFICAGVFPLGFTTGPLPCFDIQGEHLYCANALTNLFNDLSGQDARFWDARLRPQPASKWDAEIRFTGYEGVKCHYLVCQQDQLLPTALQLQFAATAQAEVTTCDAGHMVMLSQLDTLLKFLFQVIEKTTTKHDL